MKCRHAFSNKNDIAETMIELDVREISRGDYAKIFKARQSF